MQKRISEQGFQRRVNSLSNPNDVLNNIGRKRVGQFAQSRLLTDGHGNMLPKAKITDYRIDGEELYVTLHGQEIPEKNCIYPIR